ncbi:MAG: FtsQ-type POTRA domain-containing protein [Ahrensia sp.]|nr:FtsQ-type POTRA domain-containing protein [Ahrensia sp.]
MQPIRVEPRQNAPAGRRDVVSDSAALSVLPLSMRVRLRQWGRALQRMPLPRRGLGSVLAMSLILGAWTSGAVTGGHGPALSSALASIVGLKAPNIVITGLVESSETDILAALDLDEQGSLVGFDAGEARQRLLDLPWVRAVAIRKLYPDTLTVAVAERRAMAVWQHQDHLTIVDRDGERITGFGIADLLSNRFAHLPHLVGTGAALKASSILPLVAKHPEIAGRVAAYLRVADRRWDIVLANGMRLRLPEHASAEALDRIARFQAEDRLLERKVAVIDARLSDRLTLQLDEEASEARAELVSARLKAMKKAERKL